jgi:hypothetical protein
MTHLNALTGEHMESVAHGDTLEYLLERVPYTEFAHVRTEMVRKLLRSRVLDNHRLLDTYHRIVIDGSGIRTSNERCCAHCLTMTSSVTGKTIYYHKVLEAKLVTENGFALSIATEFIENPGKDVDKQDCELRAFYRLAPRLKKAFPLLPICLLLDAIYACEPVMKICEDYQWKYIINFKEGSLPAKYEEFQSLCRSVQQKNRFTFIMADNIRQEYMFATDIAHGKYTFNAIQCIEHTTDTGESKHYAWITNLTVSHDRCVAIANQGGRVRWKIENEGFNIQKNGGYCLEHAYSNNVNASKCYYLLMQISHIINQLIEKGSLISQETRKKIGSIRNIARLLLESIGTTLMTEEKYTVLFAKPFQIRLNST